MRFLTTILTATAICAAMMAAAAYDAGAPPLTEPSAGLSAATILSSDGMTPDRIERSDSRLDRLANQTIRTDRDAAR